MGFFCIISHDCMQITNYFKTKALKNDLILINPKIFSSFSWKVGRSSSTGFTPCSHNCYSIIIRSREASEPLRQAWLSSLCPILHPACFIYVTCLVSRDMGFFPLFYKEWWGWRLGHARGHLSSHNLSRVEHCIMNKNTRTHYPGARGVLPIIGIIIVFFYSSRVT